MANAQYWREQAEMLRRRARTQEQRYRRISAERLPPRLRLRCDPTSLAGSARQMAAPGVLKP